MVQEADRTQGMKIVDLGTLGGALMLFGGPYSNRHALDALQECASDLPVSNVICTGDVVAYCADASACVAQMRDWGVVCVAGNCEKQLADGAADCGCGFDEGTTCDVLSSGWFGYASKQVSMADRAWMQACPDVIVFQHAGLRCAVIHGGVSDVAKFLWPVSPDMAFEQEIEALRGHLRAQGLSDDIDRIYAGHCGLAFSRWIGDVHWVNAGVIGMPPHDGAPETRYIRVAPGGTIRPGKLSYDVEHASEAMHRAGLFQGYHAALKSGIWPSEDILPTALRRHL